MTLVYTHWMCFIGPEGLNENSQTTTWGTNFAKHLWSRYWHFVRSLSYNYDPNDLIRLQMCAECVSACCHNSEICGNSRDYKTKTDSPIRYCVSRVLLQHSWFHISMYHINKELRWAVLTNFGIVLTNDYPTIKHSIDYQHICRQIIRHLTLNMPNRFKDCKIFSHSESYLAFGLTQVDEIYPGTTVPVVCATQLIPCLTAWYWPPKPEYAFPSIGRVSRECMRWLSTYKIRIKQMDKLVVGW